MGRILGGALLFAAFAAQAGTTITRFPALHSSLLHGDEGLVRRGSPGVFLWFPGAGGGPTYSITGSMKDLVELHLAEGFDAIAAENPMYWNRDASLDERRPLVREQGSLAAQLRWFYETLALVRAQCRAVGDPQKKIYVGGRSMGAELVMEALQRYLRGDRDAAVLREVTTFVTFGLHGHLPADLDEMMRLEFLQQTKRGDLDPIVLVQSAIAMKGLGFAPDVAAPPERTPSYVPRLVGVLPVRDQYIPPWVSRATYQRFRAHNPQVPIQLILTDTEHDVAKADSYVDIHGDLYRDYSKKDKPYRVYLERLERLRPIIDFVVHERKRPAVYGDYDPAVFYLPNREVVRRAPACTDLLATLSDIDEAKFRAFYQEYFALP